MAAILVLLLLTIGLTYTSAEVRLVQPASESTTPGETVRLTCTVHGISLSKRYVHWYHQKRDSAPRFILYGTDNRGEGIPDRFTGLEEESTNVGYLTIANVQPEDAGDYYCCSYDVSDIGYFGSGTRLNIPSRQPKKPTVLLLPPSEQQIATANEATLVCMVSHFYPESVTLVWSVDGEVRQTGIQTSSTLQDSDQTYSVSSYLTLPASEWTSHELYSCGVQHQTLSSTLEQSITKSSCM
ncbi:immunoglobulin lambda-1 light chain-like [Hemiscyllium ocellatum]|uniref:immunoglobulin lambda-1 light chain-like n=1 Tax=Hemiscyllium ocellatum TaxID=170820 RepID=UPI00296708CC|nr:immunoglobulin lambda-1 light chain-like [Hemiscyllium ocellatum]